MKMPTENTYDIVLGKCVQTTDTGERFAILAPPGWCDRHSSHYYEGADYCERRLDLQNLVEHVIKTMGNEDDMSENTPPKSAQDFATEVVVRLARRYEETEPLYMIPDAVDEPMPGLRATTVGEALGAVWEEAFDQAQDVVLKMIRELKEGSEQK